jgi:hypothetical protein
MVGQTPVFTSPCNDREQIREDIGHIRRLRNTKRSLLQANTMDGPISQRRRANGGLLLQPLPKRFKYGPRTQQLSSREELSQGEEEETLSSLRLSSLEGSSGQQGAGNYVCIGLPSVFSSLFSGSLVEPLETHELVLERLHQSSSLLSEQCPPASFLVSSTAANINKSHSSSGHFDPSEMEAIVAATSINEQSRKPQLVDACLTPRQR